MPCWAWKPRTQPPSRTTCSSGRSIFGTLLERALDPLERHALGAHYRPRAYVDRLVQPTVIEPLRQGWAYAQGAAIARILSDSPAAQTQAQLTAHFTGRGRWKSRLPDILEALAALGRARCLDDGRWLG